MMKAMSSIVRSTKVLEEAAKLAKYADKGFYTKAMAYLVLLAPGQESRLRMLSGQAMGANSYS